MGYPTFAAVWSGVRLFSGFGMYGSRVIYFVHGT